MVLLQALLVKMPTVPNQQGICPATGTTIMLRSLQRVFSENM
jgi:hypothetical protein